MDNVITEYKKWKNKGEKLRIQAKQAMEARFHDLLTEAAQISQEYHRDFGASLKPPVNITAFRFKVPAGRKGKKGAKAASAKAPDPVPDKPAATPSPKVAALYKQRAQI